MASHSTMVVYTRRGPISYIDASNYPPCPGCKKDFQEGEYVTIIPIGPGGDPKERKRKRENKPYTSTGVIAHWACVTGEENEKEGF